MSASSRPTLAPESCSEAARLTATVDLPTPPLPDATAMTCLTPGMACSPARPPNEGRMLAVIFRSTAVTPGSPLTSSCAMVWDRSRTGHAGVVSSNVKLTFPPSEMVTSLIIPRLTTSRPRSGSLIADRTERTWSLLGTEDHRGAHRQDRNEHHRRHDCRLDRDWRHRGAFATRLDARRPANAEERRTYADQGNDPERKPRKDATGFARGRHGDEECDEQGELQHPEVAVRQAQPLQGEPRVGPKANQQGDQRRRTAETGREEQAAQRPCVAPHRLVAHAEQDAGVGGDEQANDGAGDVEHLVEARR